MPNFFDEKNYVLPECMFLSCHVRVSEWIHIVAWMWRNSLLETGAKSEVYVTATGLEQTIT